MGAFEFFTRQVIHEDILYFSFEIRKGQFLSQAMKEKKKDNTAKFFNKFKHLLQMNRFCFFFREEKFLPGSDGELTEQPLAWSVPTRCTDIDESQTPCLCDFLGHS